jgi:hypothetical protein
MKAPIFPVIIVCTLANKISVEWIEISLYLVTRVHFLHSFRRIRKKKKSSITEDEHSGP